MKRFLQRVRCWLRLHRTSPFMAVMKINTDGNQWITYNVVVHFCRECGWKGGRIR